MKFIILYILYYIIFWKAKNLSTNMFSWLHGKDGQPSCHGVPLRPGVLSDQKDGRTPQPPSIPAQTTLMEQLLLSLNNKNFAVLKTALREIFKKLTPQDREGVATSACGSVVLSFSELKSFTFHLLDYWALLLPRVDHGVLLATLMQILRAVDAHVCLEEGFVLVEPREHKGEGRIVFRCETKSSTVRTESEHLIIFFHEGERASVVLSVSQNSGIIRTKYLHLSWLELMRFAFKMTSMQLEGRHRMIQHVLSVVFEFVWSNRGGVPTFHNCDVVSVNPVLGMCCSMKWVVPHGGKFVLDQETYVTILVPR